MKSLLTIIGVVLFTPVFTSQVLAQWTVQDSGIPLDDQVVLAAVSPDTCWGVTRDPGTRYVVRTTNGGTTWAASHFPLLHDFYGIAATCADTAWIAADSAIYNTTDGGVTWIQQLATGRMLVVRFFDSKHGVAIGDGSGGNAEMYTTMNGGTLWTPVPSSNIPLLQSEGFIPANSWVVGSTIWAPTNGQSLYKSTDRGITWSKTINVVSTGGSYCAFRDSLNGLLCGSLAGTVKRTTDGGATWVATETIPQGISTLFMSYVPGTSGSYMVTATPPHGPLPGSAYTLDNGATWRVVDSVSHGRATFVSPSVGWSWGGANVIYTWSGPSLGGWTVQHSGTTNSLLHVRAVSQSVAWAEGIGATVLRTTNGGDTWTPASGGAFGSDYLSGIEAVTSDIAFVPYNPGGGTTTHIYRTTNGGANWNSVYVQNPGAINVIRMVDAANGIAVGDPAGGKWTVLKTSDGGSTWARILTEPNQIGGEIGSWFDGMCVIGPTHIWFTSQSGRVYWSTDGGATWIYSAIPFTGFLPRIHFNDTQYGLVGNLTGFSVGRTTDGGVSWSEITLPNSAHVGGITGSEDDFYVNKGQQIFHSGDHGATYALSYPGGITGELRGNCSVVDGTNIRVWAVTTQGEILRYDGPLTGTVDVEENHLEIPGAFKLEQNYPNPFNPSTTIEFRVASFGFVSLKVYDVLGREVRTLVDEMKSPGTYSAAWDARGMASGVYFYRLTTGMFTATRRMMVVK